MEGLQGRQMRNPTLWCLPHSLHFAAIRQLRMCLALWTCSKWLQLKGLKGKSLTLRACTPERGVAVLSCPCMPRDCGLSAKGDLQG